MKQVLDFIKTNVVALTWGVVALLAIIAVFIFPIPGMFGELRDNVTKRQETASAIDTLGKTPRTLPTLDPTVPEAVPLNAFPTSAVIAQGKKAIEQVKDAAGRVLAQAVKMNIRTPLVPDVLPNPSSLARNNFFNAYRIATAQFGENADRGIIRTVLHGTLPPTTDELTAIESARANEIRKTNLQTDARGVPQNQTQVDSLIAAMRSQLGMGERVRRAQTYQIYVSPGAVEIHPAMASVSELNAVNIFNAQFSLWLQQIVLESIADANKGAKNVLDAPVKHLVLLRVPMNIADPNNSGGYNGGGGAAMGGGGDAGAAPAGPVELKPDAAAAITPNYTRDPLGYVSNAMYDPIHVQMILRVDASRMTESLAALSRNHLIKIRNVSFHTVDVGVALSNGFYYSREGKTPLVEVELDCDVLMLREWVVRYMPDPVKAVFNAMANPTAAPQ